MKDTEQPRSLKTRYLSPQQNGGSMRVEHTGGPNAGRAAIDTMLSIAVLTVHESYQGDERRFDMPLDQRALKLGRTAQGGPQGPNDIVLEALFVARDQARIEPAGLGHRVVELGAPNHLTIQGQPLGTQPYVLRDGDVLQLHHTDSSAVVTLTYKNPLLQAAEQPPEFKSHYLDPKQVRTAIGRQGCAVLLDHPTVSRVHTWIDRLPDGSHSMRDAGSANGTFVNGQRITQHMLTAGDIIQIGPFKLVYQRNRLDQYDQRRGMHIDVRDLTYTVAIRGKQKTILQAVSLSIAPREFVAIVGGSGAGKSTLMRAISGSVRAAAGQVLVNGDDLYQHFDAYRALMGYVPQDDILHQTLQVDRALDYAARLRLSADSDASEIRQRVEQALGDVDIVTHATENIALCDHVVFMAGGRMVFFGPPAEALSFFGVTSGLFSDIYTRLEGQADPDDPDRWAVVQRDLKEEYDAWLNLQQTKDEGPKTKAAPQQRQSGVRPWSSDLRPPTMAELWELKYHGSASYQQYIANRLARSTPVPVKRAPAAPAARRPRPARQSPLRQLALLTRRYVELTIRDRLNVMILLLQAPIIALMNLLMIRSDVVTGATATDLIPRLQAQSFLFVLAPIGVWFGVINAAREITKEQAIYRRERLWNLALLRGFCRALGRRVAAVAGAICQYGVGIARRHGAGVDYQRAVRDQRPGHQHGAAGAGAADHLHRPDLSP